MVREYNSGIIRTVQILSTVVILNCSLKGQYLEAHRKSGWEQRRLL